MKIGRLFKIVALNDGGSIVLLFPYALSLFIRENIGATNNKV